MPYLVIAGPTGVGKTEVALDVADAIGGEIVIADSRQVYRGLDVGTAKPTAAERTRIPHHLIDVVDPGEAYTAADYARDAGRALEAIESRGRVPVVCGGTGLYLEALAGGLDPMDPVDDATRERVGAIRLADRHAELARLDPEAGARLHPHDRQRVQRALEVRMATGRPLAAYWTGEAAPRPHVAIRLDRPRPELRRRIEERLEAMLAAGLEAEARALHAAGWTPADPGVDSIGYQEWWPHFEGRIPREEAVRRILVATRRYAKRQETWFRRRGRYHPVEARAGAERVVEIWAGHREDGR